MDEKLTPEEVSKITGEDLENVEDQQNPERIEPEEGNAPIIERAAFDDEIEEEDKSDEHLKDVNFDELEIMDRELYMQMTSIRGACKEGMKVKDRIDDLIKMIKAEHNKSLNNSQKEFLAMINNKLLNMSLEIQAEEKGIKRVV